MKTVRIIAPLVAAMAASGSLVTGQVMAADGSLVLEEVIVTAQKRSQSLQDVPFTVTAIGAEELEQANIGDIHELQFSIPSLSIATNNSPMNSNIRLRGAGSGGNEPSIEASVGVFIDGVYQSRSGNAIADIVDIEGIEVLYGPQGTLYGKNTNAGVISVRSKKPTREFEGKLSYTVGDRDLNDVSASISGPLSESLSFRLSGRDNSSAGWLENDSLDTVSNGSDEQNIRGQLLFDASDELELRFIYSKGKRRPDCCASEVAYGPDFYTMAEAAGVVLDGDQFDRHVSANGKVEFEQDSESASLTADWSLGNFTLTSITAWDEYKATRSGDEDRSILDLINVQDLQEGESYSQELRLTSPGGEALEYIAGLYYYNNDLTRGNGTAKQWRTQTGEDIFLTGPIIAPNFAPSLVSAPGELSYLNHRWQQQSYSAFAQGHYHISEAWELVAGLRYSYDEKEADIRIDSVTTAPLSFTKFVTSPFTNDTGLKREGGNTTGMLSVLYTPTEDMTYYATLANGFKSGGFNGTAGEIADREYDDEQSVNFEVGIKSELMNKRLRLNVAAYRTEYTDFQALSFNGDAASFYVVNAPEQVTQGVDFDAEFVVTSNIVSGLSLAYLDAEYKDYQQGPCYAGNPDEVIDNSAGALISTGVCDLSGRSLPFAPKWAANFFAMAHWQMDAGTSFLRLDWASTQSHMIDTQLTPELTDSYDLINLSAGFETENWQLTLWGKNITDQTNAMLAASVPLISDTTQYWLNAPRSFGATVRYVFPARP